MVPFYFHQNPAAGTHYKYHHQCWKYDRTGQHDCNRNAFCRNGFKSNFANKRVYFISALRMLVIPLIALFLIKISHLATLSADAQKIMLIVFLAVITPSASTVTQMCQVYGNDAHYASAINVVTTLCAIVTMPFMVLLFSCI